MNHILVSGTNGSGKSFQFLIGIMNRTNCSRGV